MSKLRTVMTFPPGAVTERGDPLPVLTAVNLQRAALRWWIVGLVFVAFGLLAFEPVGVVCCFLAPSPLFALALLEFWAERRPASHDTDAAAALAVALTAWIGFVGVAVQVLYVNLLLVDGVPVPDALADALGQVDIFLVIALAALALPFGFAAHLRIRRLFEGGWSGSLRLGGYTIAVLAVLASIRAVDLGVLIIIYGALAYLIAQLLRGVYGLADMLVVWREARRDR